MKLLTYRFSNPGHVKEHVKSVTDFDVREYIWCYFAFDKKLIDGGDNIINLIRGMRSNSRIKRVDKVI